MEDACRAKANFHRHPLEREVMRRVQSFSMRLLFVLLALSPSLHAVDGDFSRRVASELNFARTHPGAYAGILGSEGSRRDARALGEAVKFLRGTHPLPPLGWCASLAAAARDHAEAQGVEGGFGHKCSVGSLHQRIARHAGPLQSIGETIFYGKTTPRGVVMAWIVDSGIRSRGHRRIIFEPRFQLVGIAHGPHARYGTMTVADFGGSEAFSGSKRKCW
jgi:uncharacterized protein YkwD